MAHFTVPPTLPRHLHSIPICRRAGAARRRASPSPLAERGHESQPCGRYCSRVSRISFAGAVIPCGRTSTKSTTAAAIGLASMVRARLSCRLALNSHRKSSGLCPAAAATAIPRRANSTRRGRSSAGMCCCGSSSSALAAMSSNAPSRRGSPASYSSQRSVTSSRSLMTGVSMVIVLSTRS
ncbi:hypothetical protein D3C78_1350850 [compost metagenome]